MVKTLSEDEKKDIINRYQNTNEGLETIGKYYKVGKLKIKAVLREFNVLPNKRGGQVKDGVSKTLETSKVSKYQPPKGKILVARCKKSNLEFNDSNNTSGSLTKHIIKTYGDVDIPNNTYQRKKYFKLHNKHWFEEYFDIVEKIISETKRCAYCKWETIDINNLSGQYQIHLKSEHNISINDYIKEYPDDLKFFNKYKTTVERKKELSNVDNFVICEICGEKLKSITNTHLKTHGITPMGYKIKYPNSKLISEKLHTKFSEQMKVANINIKPSWTSRGEIELKEFIENLGFNVKKSKNRGLLKGKEIDIIIPTLKLGIEYNGLYYHTDVMGKNYSYHLDKTIACKNIGYDLIHIFEDEWKLDGDLIKNKIKHILGVGDGVKIGARKCIIKEIDSKIKSKFLNDFHIQHNDKSNINLGAFYGDILVGVMTFKTNRLMTSDMSTDEYELSRFATNYGYIISGLPSKILSYFKKAHHPKKIISFADRRWTLNQNNNMYTKLGFKLINIGKPNYWYYNSKVNRLKRFHKFGFGKSSLKLKYPYLDFTKTERELTKELGYDRIWDCGLFKYELTI